jgi:hypothetical protein
LLASSSNEDSLARCRTENFCSQEGLTLREEAQERATISTILFAVGGALTAGGIALVIVGARSRGSDEEQSAAPSWQLASMLGPGRAGLTLRGRW